MSPFLGSSGAISLLPQDRLSITASASFCMTFGALLTSKDPVKLLKLASPVVRYLVPFDLLKKKNKQLRKTMLCCLVLLLIYGAAVRVRAELPV